MSEYHLSKYCQEIIQNTTVSITPQGIKALSSYIEEMEGIIKTLKQA